MFDYSEMTTEELKKAVRENENIIVHLGIELDRAKNRSQAMKVELGQRLYSENLKRQRKIMLSTIDSENDALVDSLITEKLEDFFKSPDFAKKCIAWTDACLLEEEEF